MAAIYAEAMSHFHLGQSVLYSQFADSLAKSDSDAGESAEQAQPVSAGAPQPLPAHRAIGAGMKIATLGIMVQVARNDGAEITDVAPNGVAALAGLHPGDVINSVDGKPVKTPMELAAELAGRAPGIKVRLGYSLHGQWQAETIIVLP
jgi:S1-C subfamily serine protease